MRGVEGFVVFVCEDWYIPGMFLVVDNEDN